MSAPAKARRSLTESVALEPLSLVSGKERHCADCGAVLRGEFCSVCGQHCVEPPRTFWGLMAEWFASYFNLEGKLLVSLKVLIRQPGELSLEYFRGRRTRYFPPLKLYLTMSVIFFSIATLSLTGQRVPSAEEARAAERTEIIDSIKRSEEQSFEDLDDEDDASAKQFKAMAIAWQKMGDQILRARLQAFDENRPVSKAERDKLTQAIKDTRAATLAIKEELPQALRSVATQMIESAMDNYQARVDDRLIKDVDGTPRARVTKIIEDIAAASPRGLFFFLPLFAGVYALFFRKKSFYVESFVFTLHLHSFFLALALVNILLSFIPGSGLLMVVGMAVYSYLAMRRVFSITRGHAIRATILASMAYASIFAILGMLTEKAGFLACALGGKCT